MGSIPKTRVIKPNPSKQKVTRVSKANRPRHVTVVSVPTNLADEETFLKIAGWTKRKIGDCTVYSGLYHTQHYGPIQGFVECYEIKSSSGHVIGKSYLCFVSRLPSDVVHYYHSACFPWNRKREAFLVHFEREPQSIQECVLSVERAIDQIKSA